MTSGTRRSHPTKKPLTAWYKKIEDQLADDMVPGGGKSDDILILVMGQTGAGKSSFINSLFDREVVQVGHELYSCTAALQPVILDQNTTNAIFPYLNGRRLVIVDTPGFDDELQNDSDIMKSVSNWITRCYGKDMKLGGVIYLHDISQTRMTGASRNISDTFQKFYGQYASKLILLSTTKWSLTTRAEGMARQKQFEDKFWHNLIAGGAHVIPLDDKYPWRLIKEAVLGSDKLLITQDALVELRESIPETEAGKMLLNTFEQLIAIQKQQGIQLSELQRFVTEATRLRVPLSRRIMNLFGL